MKIKITIKHILVLVSLFFILPAVKGQELPEDIQLNKKGRFYIAPDFGLVFGTITRIEVSPALGYHITDRFSVAAGGRYEFYQSKGVYNLPGYRTNIWGIRSFTRYEVIKDLHNIIPLNLHLGFFGHLEYEALNLDGEYFSSPFSNIEGRYWLDTVLVGFGMMQQTGMRSAINILALWDTNTGSSSPYTSPILRFSFQFYL